MEIITRKQAFAISETSSLSDFVFDEEVLRGKAEWMQLIHQLWEWKSWGISQIGEEAISAACYMETDETTSKKREVADEDIGDKGNGVA